MTGESPIAHSGKPKRLPNSLQATKTKAKSKFMAPSFASVEHVHVEGFLSVVSVIGMFSQLSVLEYHELLPTKLMRSSLK